MDKSRILITGKINSMPKKGNKSAFGFTIAELLLALAITGLMLTAVAIAFNASIINYHENKKIAETSNHSRLALSRITNQLRTADSVDPCSPNYQCTLNTADGNNITFHFDDTNDTLYLITNDNPTDADYVLCDNVTAMTFVKQTVTVGLVTYVKSVQISMTVQNDNVQQVSSAAAIIRRNLQ